MLVSLRLLWQNTWENQQSAQFQRLQVTVTCFRVCCEAEHHTMCTCWSRAAYLMAAVRRAGKGKWSGTRCTLPGHAPSDLLIQLGPTSYCSPFPNNAIKLWIYQWNNPLLRLECYVPTTFPKIHQVATKVVTHEALGSLYIQTIWCFLFSIEIHKQLSFVRSPRNNYC
jgi:hypothetical protein